MILTLAGVVVILASLVMVVDSMIRRETKKPWLITAGLGLVLLSIGVVRGSRVDGVVVPSPATTSAASESQEVSPLPSPEKLETPEEVAYRELVTGHCARLLTLFQELLLQIQSPYSSSDWMILVKAKTEQIRNLCGEVATFEVPSSRREVQSKYLEAMNHYVIYTYVLEKGLEGQTPDVLSEACAELDAGNDCIKEAKALMNAEEKHE